MEDEKTVREQVLEKGGPTKVASLMKLTEGAVRRWMRENRIPIWHQEKFSKI